jgi:hypothetical protein
MELSIEAKLAAAVALAFAVLGTGAITRERGEVGSGATAYGPASGSGPSHITARRLNISWSGLRGGTDGNEVLGLH